MGPERPHAPASGSSLPRCSPLPKALATSPGHVQPPSFKEKRAKRTQQKLGQAVSLPTVTLRYLLAPLPTPPAHTLRAQALPSARHHPFPSPLSPVSGVHHRLLSPRMPGELSGQGQDWTPFSTSPCTPCHTIQQSPLPTASCQVRFI